MINEIESFEEFIAICRDEQTKATTPVFIKQRKNIDQNSYVVTGEIIIMIQYDTNMFIAYLHDEEIPSFQDIPIQYLDLIERINVDTKKQIETMLQQKNQNMINKMNEEEQKIKTVFSNMGFKIFINGIWE